MKRLLLLLLLFGATPCFADLFGGTDPSIQSAETAILGTTNTWTAGQTFNAAVTLSSNVIAGGSQGTAGQSLQSNAGSAPTWVNVPAAILATTSTWTANQIFSSATVTQLNSSTITVTTGIVGSTDGSSAPVGDWGAYVSSKSIGSAALPATTTNWGDMLSITLPAGDWEISAQVFLAANGGTVVFFEVGISTTSGNSTAGLLQGDNYLSVLPPVATANQSVTIASYHPTPVNAAATYFFKASASYSVATPTFRSRISAKRIR